MKKYVIALMALFHAAININAQPIELDPFLNKADLATSQYIKTFKNLIAEELRTYEYFRKDGTLEDSRKITSVFIVYQSPNNNLVAEYRNVTNFNGKNVARSDDDIVNFFGKLAKASSSDEEISRLRNEGNRFDGKSSSYGMTLAQTFVLNQYYRPFFEFKIVGREQIDGHDTIIVEYKQVKPTMLIKANATDVERKQEPRGISFDTELPSDFRPTNPRLQGRLWLDAETAELWRNEFSVAIQPAAFSKPSVSGKYPLRISVKRIRHSAP